MAGVLHEDAHGRHGLRHRDNQPWHVGRDRRWLAGRYSAKIADVTAISLERIVVAVTRRLWSSCGPDGHRSVDDWLTGTPRSDEQLLIALSAS